MLSVGRSSYTSRVFGTLASLYVDLNEAVFSKFTEFVQLTLNGFSFHLAILTNERRQPSANGTNRSQLRCPGRSLFNPSRLNKAVECFGGTSPKQTQHIQSLEDISWKIALKRDVIKTVGARLLILFSHTINAKGLGTTLCQ